MATTQDFLDLAEEALPATIKDVQTFYKIGKAAEKSRKELKGVAIAEEHLGVFKKNWLSRQEKVVKAQVQRYGQMNRAYRSVSFPDFTKHEKACAKAKTSGNDKAYFKAYTAFDKALRAHLRDLADVEASARKLLPRARKLLKHHEVQFAVANSLQDSFKTIVKVAVVGPYQTEFTIYMLHAKDLAGFHASARSELRRVIKTLDKLIKETKSDIKYTNDQITYIGSDDFEKSLAI